MKRFFIPSIALFLLVSSIGLISVKAASNEFSDLLSGETILYESGYPSVSFNGYVSESRPEKALVMDNELLVSVNGLISDTLNEKVVLDPTKHTISLFSGDNCEKTVIDYMANDSGLKVLNANEGDSDIYLPANKVFSEDTLKKIYNKTDKTLKFTYSLGCVPDAPERNYEISVSDSLLSNMGFTVEEDFSIEKLSMKAQETKTRRIILNFPDVDPIRLQKETYSKGKYIENAFTESSGNGGSRIVFELNRICAADIKENGSAKEISFVLPREKYSRIVVVDPGHGGYDYGAIRDQVKEAWINLEIAQNLRDELEKEGIKVYMTRDKDVFLQLETRPAFSTEIEADMFISIHQNTHSSIKEHGLAVYYSKDNNEAAENGFCSKVLGQKVIRNLYYDLNIYSNGLLTTPLSVTAHNKVPAILIECGFMTNPDEFAKLQDSAYQKQYGENLAKSVIELFTEYPTGR